MGDKQAELLLEAWKKTVDVQQHFNQIEMDIRRTAVTLALAVMGAAGVAADKAMRVMLWNCSIPLATCILLAGAVAWGCFWFMDYSWYHRLLRGAVNLGKDLEIQLKDHGVEAGLTARIAEASPVKMWFKKEPLHSNEKITFFYATVAALLALFAIAAAFVPMPPATGT